MRCILKRHWLSKMQTEFEVKFCKVDHDEVRQRLQAAGAKLEQPMRLMRRHIFDHPDNKLQKEHGFLRLRDEGNKVTLTYKQFPGEHSVDNAKEIGVDVSSFEETAKLLEACGLVSCSFQESKRETWTLDGGEIVLDIWPWLSPFIEIEAGSEAHVRELTSRLGFDWSDAVFGDAVAAYRTEYDVPSGKLGHEPKVAFDAPRPSWMVPKQ